MAEPEAMPAADAVVHEMDTPESEEDACSWRALMETLAVVGDPPKRGSARSDDVTSEEPSIVAPFVNADAVPARWGLHVSGAVHGGWVKQTSPACAAAVACICALAVLLPDRGRGAGGSCAGVLGADAPGRCSGPAWPSGASRGARALDGPPDDDSTVEFYG